MHIYICIYIYLPTYPLAFSCLPACHLPSLACLPACLCPFLCWLCLVKTCMIIRRVFVALPPGLSSSSSSICPSLRRRSIIRRHEHSFAARVRAWPTERQTSVFLRRELFGRIYIAPEFMSSRTLFGCMVRSEGVKRHPVWTSELLGETFQMIKRMACGCVMAAVAEWLAERLIMDQGIRLL